MNQKWRGKQLRKNSLKLKKYLRVWVHIRKEQASFVHSTVATYAAPLFWHLFDFTQWESCDQYAVYPNFPHLLSIVTFSLWESNSLNVGTKDIFPGRILKFGRHFERVEKNFNFSTRDPGHLHACALARVAPFFLKIDFFFGTTHGDKPTSQNGISLRSPSLIMAPVINWTAKSFDYSGLTENFLEPSEVLNIRSTN